MGITWNDTDTFFIIVMAVTSSNASSIDVTIAWNNNTSIIANVAVNDSTNIHIFGDACTDKTTVYIKDVAGIDTVCDNDTRLACDNDTHITFEIIAFSCIDVRGTIIIIAVTCINADDASIVISQSGTTTIFIIDVTCIMDSLFP